MVNEASSRATPDDASDLPRLEDRSPACLADANSGQFPELPRRTGGYHRDGERLAMADSLEGRDRVAKTSAYLFPAAVGASELRPNSRHQMFGNCF